MGKATNPNKEPKLVRLARNIGVPRAVSHQGEYERADVSSFSNDDDQRAVMRGRGYTKDKHEGRSTLKRRSRLGTEPMRKLLLPRELAACEWYADQHAWLYDTQVKTADWEAGSPTSDRAYGHWPAGLELGPWKTMFEYAREAIPESSLELFEDVVLHCGLIGRRALAFKHAVMKLVERIEGKVEL